MARAVRFDLVADASKFTRGMRDAQRSSEKFTQHTSNAGKALKAAVGAFSVGIVVNQMKNWVAAARDSNRVAAETVARLKSTHGAAGLSAQGFSDLAKSISKTTAVDDDLIQGGENIIATFTAIHGDVFKKTTKAAVDLAAGMNHGEVTAEGLQTASIQLGKALQDPISGLTSLQRIGIKFTDQQKQQIATMVHAGDVAGAQGVILAEVNRQFAGSAAAAVTPAKQLAVTWGNMQEVLGNLLIPAIDRGAQILNSILGVVDRNRTAFGVLFGVLGTGAAIVGTLIVAEKIHAAVTDSVKVATTAWAAVQKGMNVILGTTALQAKATAEAEGGLAASTAAAGASSAGMRASLLTSVPVLGALTFGFFASRDAIKHNVSLYDELRSKLGFHVKAIDDAKAATDAATVANQKLAADAAAAGVSEGQLAGKTLEQGRALVDTTAKTNEFKAKLKEARDELAQNRDSMAQTIESYQGLISKSKLTAAEVVKDLQNQVANFRTYAKDAQTLIRRGVDTAAIRELSEKGPEYVHALAVGSNKRLGEYKQAWADRQKAIQGAFSRSIDAQYAKLKQTIEDMKDKINELSGKTIYITAKASVKIDASVRAYLAAANVPGFHQKGTLVPGYGGGDIYPAMLEPGEGVVPKDKARRPEFRAWAKAMGIPGFQFGGLASRFRTPTIAETRRIGTSEAMVAAAVLGQLGGSAGIKAFIRSTDPLPYIWGGVGPGGYDCSGLTGEVLNRMQRRPSYHRRFTTASNFGALGFKPGLGGVYQIGVTPGRGHMVGMYGGLAFEAESTRTGIKVGAAATKPASMARHYHMAKGGLVGPMDREALKWLTDQRLAIGGDPAKLRIDRFDRGGVLMPGRAGVNLTSTPERVIGPQEAIRLHPDSIRALADEIAKRPLVMDGRRVDRQQATARTLNSRRN